MNTYRVFLGSGNEITHSCIAKARDEAEAMISASIKHNLSAFRADVIELSTEKVEIFDLEAI